MYLWFALAAFITGVLWYYFRIVLPYAEFPSCRIEHRVPLWILTGKNSNRLVFETMIKISNRYEREGMFILWCGMPYLMIYNEDIVKAIMKDPTAIDRPLFYKLFEFATNKGILTSNGDEFRRLRKLMQPAFHSSVLRGQVQNMNRIAGDLVDHLSSIEGLPTYDLMDILFKYTLQLASDCILGSGGRTLDPDQTHEIAQQLGKFAVNRIWSPWLYLDLSLYLHPYGRRMLRLRQMANDEMKSIVKKIKEKLLIRQKSAEKLKPETDPELTGDTPKYCTLADVIVEEHMKDQFISVEDMGNQISILVVASYEATAWSLMWCLFMLGLHPRVQERSFAEIQDKICGDVQFEDIDKLEYLEIVIKESLRLYPTFPLFARQLKKDLKCGMHEIPRNTMVVLFPYKLHRNPEIFPDPESFKPERFLENDSKIKSWNFIPFAEGNRPCPGKNFALMEMKIVLAHVIRKFKIISLDRKEDLPLTWSFLLESAENPRMQFIPRNS